jgi:lycopene cyclase domain-containing protein
VAPVSYLVFSLLFVALALVPVAGAVVRQRTGRRWWRAVAFSMVVLLVLTVIFDSLMVHVDLFRYDQSRSLGLDVLLTPVEDLAWPVAAALLVPSLWVLATPRGDRRSLGVRSRRGDGPREDRPE